MKIEKITENQIRIILKQEDFKNKSLDIQNFLLTNPESQSLFLEILNKAKEEVNFDTDGHKLLIEAYFQNDDIFIFTITKYIETENTSKPKPKQYLTVKKKNQNWFFFFYLCYRPFAVKTCFFLYGSNIFFKLSCSKGAVSRSGNNLTKRLDAYITCCINSVNIGSLF